jgi:hypothetical protein
MPGRRLQKVAEATSKMVQNPAKPQRELPENSEERTQPTDKTPEDSETI